MKGKYALVFFILSVISVMAIPQSAPLTESFQLLLRRLDDNAFLEREAATKQVLEELAAKPEPTINMIIHALDKEEISLEVRYRLERVLETKSIDWDRIFRMSREQLAKKVKESKALKLAHRIYAGLKPNAGEYGSGSNPEKSRLLESEIIKLGGRIIESNVPFPGLFRATYVEWEKNYFIISPYNNQVFSVMPARMCSEQLEPMSWLNESEIFSPTDRKLFLRRYVLDKPLEIHLPASIDVSTESGIARIYFYRHSHGMLGWERSISGVLARSIDEQMDKYSSGRERPLVALWAAMFYEKHGLSATELDIKLDK